jgi:uncharacterized protein (DUF488 family)
MTQTVYTIGHSNGTTERLLGLLGQHGIAAIADVRSRPYSRFNPQFNREELSAALKAAGIGYVFLGQELGARSGDPSCYRDGRAQYALMAQTPLFARGIERLLAGAEAQRVAILCAEKEPLTCHRSMLIARYLHERSVAVRHILEDGTLEEHDALLDRLLAVHDMQEDHLFHSKEERISMAYEKQAEAIEYSATQVSQPA